jgi:hypothetical protein
VWAVVVKRRQLGEVPSVAILGRGKKKGDAAADFCSSCRCKNKEKKRGELWSWGCESIIQELQGSAPCRWLLHKILFQEEESVADVLRAAEKTGVQERAAAGAYLGGMRLRSKGN